MKLSDFSIGSEFRTEVAVWRCTDIGSRTVAAIRIDSVCVASTVDPRTINQSAAEAEGWFRGPPYAVAEVVFDEDAQSGCVPA